jgi:excisionase family DNA binding protein
MATPISELKDPADSQVDTAVERTPRRKGIRSTSGRLLDLKAAEIYSGISAWTLRDLIASGELPAVRPPRLRRVWIDRADLDRAIAEWKERSAG